MSRQYSLQTFRKSWILSKISYCPHIFEEDENTFFQIFFRENFQTNRLVAPVVGPSCISYGIWERGNLTIFWKIWGYNRTPRAPQQMYSTVQDWKPSSYVRKIKILSM